MNRKIEQTELDATTRYDLHTRLEGMPKHNKVCHGDFNPSNIIITEDGTPYIIDWSHATQGNASADAQEHILFFGLTAILRAQRSIQIFSAARANCKAVCSKVDADCSCITVG